MSAGEASGHRVPFEGPCVRSNPLRSYDVTPDGEFIMLKTEENPPDQRVTKLNVVLGWGEELKRRGAPRRHQGARTRNRSRRFLIKELS